VQQAFAEPIPAAYFPLHSAAAAPYPHPLPPCGDFGYWGGGRLTRHHPTLEEKNGRCQQ
jgi:hypothetical protein